MPSIEQIEDEGADGIGGADFSQRMEDVTVGAIRIIDGVDKLAPNDDIMKGGLRRVDESLIELQEQLQRLHIKNKDKKDKSLATERALIADNATLVTKNATLVAEKAALMVEMDAMVAKNGALVAEVEVLVADKNTMVADMASLQDSVQNSQAREKLAFNEVTIAQQQLDDLNATKESTEALIADLQGQLDVAKLNANKIAEECQEIMMVTLLCFSRTRQYEEEFKSIKADWL